MTSQPLGWAGGNRKRRRDCSRIMVIAVSVLCCARLYFIGLQEAWWSDAASATAGFVIDEELPPFGGPRQNGGPAVAILISSMEKDIHNVMLAIRSFDDNIMDDGKTPFLLFNENDLSLDQRERIANSTTREVMFPHINFSSYPDGFHPDNETLPGFRKRSDWGYQQMCRFWLTGLWQHHVVVARRFSTIMRMDADSCFWNQTTVGDLMPNLASDQFVYRTNIIKVGGHIKGLWEVTTEYVINNNLVPKNPELWRQANETFQQTGNLPLFFNNFEISRVSFFAREEVMKYQRRIAEEEPFGIFRQRWGDAPIRFLTLAIFANPREIDLNPPPNYAHGRPRKENRGCPGLDFVFAG